MCLYQYLRLPRLGNLQTNISLKSECSRIGLCDGADNDNQGREILVYCLDDNQELVRGCGLDVIVRGPSGQEMEGIYMPVLAGKVHASVLHASPLPYLSRSI